MLVLISDAEDLGEADEMDVIDRLVPVAGLNVLDVGCGGAPHPATGRVWCQSPGGRARPDPGSEEPHRRGGVRVNLYRRSLA